MKTLRHRYLITMGMIVCLWLSVIASIWAINWLKGSQSTGPDRSASDSPAPVIIEEKPAPVLVTMPGTKPVLALLDDYNLDSSLWRVVSKAWPLADSHYQPTNLELATVPSRTDKTIAERSVRADIMPNLEKLFKAAHNLGYDLMIGSGYRSYDLQKLYYTSYVQAHGQSQADAISAKPGQSEHQTGLVVDLAYQDRHCYLANCFGDSPAGQWLAANAHAYGFILRYPKAKSAITGYQYEPWHFRYVGLDLAQAIHESNLTLDEVKPYLDQAQLELKARAEL